MRTKNPRFGVSVLVLAAVCFLLSATAQPLSSRKVAPPMTDATSLFPRTPLPPGPREHSSIPRELLALLQGGTIQGVVYEDVDGDGERDPREPGMGGVQIVLRESSGPIVTTTVTESDGSYRFEALSAGYYCVDEINPRGYASTTEDTVCLPFLSEGATLECDFGDRRISSATPSTGTPGPQATPTATLLATLTPTLGPTATSSQTPTAWIDVSQAIPAWCKSVYLGDTTGKANNAERYKGLPWQESGPEDVYVLQKTVTSDLTVTIEMLEGDDLDVFLLYNASPDALLAHGNTSFTYRNLSPATYYIVVDGYMGAMGPYRLHVDCEGEPTPTPSVTPSPTPTNTPVFSYGPLLLKMPTPTPTVTPTVVPHDQAVNCGGQAGYQASDGYWYEADQPYSHGGWGWQGGDVYALDHAIADTNDDLIYQSHRYSIIGYHFTVPNGRYEVLLRFAEIFPYAKAGDRVFAVALEGQRVLDGFDILGNVSRYRAHDRTFHVDVTDGVLSITFEQQAQEYSPAINAIRLHRTGQVP